MDLFREAELAEDGQRPGRAMDNTERRIQLLKSNSIGETVITDLLGDIERKYCKENSFLESIAALLQI